jgi:hypothetical protein
LGGSAERRRVVNKGRMTTSELVLARGLWDCMVAAGTDVSDYCRGGPSDPFWRGTYLESLDAGFEQWLRMRSAKEMTKEAVADVDELRECGG